MNRELKMYYGPLCDSIEEQLTEQGYYLEPDELNKANKIRDAITMCMFHVATDSQVDSMFKKLNKMIVKNIKLLEKKEEL